MYPSRSRNAYESGARMAPSGHIQHVDTALELLTNALGGQMLNSIESLGLAVRLEAHQIHRRLELGVGEVRSTFEGFSISTFILCIDKTIQITTLLLSNKVGTYFCNEECSNGTQE